jgi:hypothetical protein
MQPQVAQEKAAGWALSHQDTVRGNNVRKSRKHGTAGCAKNAVTGSRLRREPVTYRSPDFL